MPGLSAQVFTRCMSSSLIAALAALAWMWYHHESCAAPKSESIGLTRYSTTDLVVYRHPRAAVEQVSVYMKARLSDLEHRVETATDRLELMIQMDLQRATRLNGWSTWDRMADTLLRDLQSELNFLKIALMRSREPFNRLDHVAGFIRYKFDRVYGLIRMVKRFELHEASLPKSHVEIKKCEVSHSAPHIFICGVIVGLLVIPLTMMICCSGGPLPSAPAVQAVGVLGKRKRCA